MGLARLRAKRALIFLAEKMRLKVVTIIKAQNCCFIVVVCFRTLKLLMQSFADLKYDCIQMQSKKQMQAKIIYFSIRTTEQQQHKISHFERPAVVPLKIISICPYPIQNVSHVGVIICYKPYMVHNTCIVSIIPNLNLFQDNNGCIEFDAL